MQMENIICESGSINDMDVLTPIDGDTTFV